MSSCTGRVRLPWAHSEGSAQLCDQRFQLRCAPGEHRIQLGAAIHPVGMAQGEEVFGCASRKHSVPQRHSAGRSCLSQPAAWTSMPQSHRWEVLDGENDPAQSLPARVPEGEGAVMRPGGARRTCQVLQQRLPVALLHVPAGGEHLGDSEGTKTQQAAGEGMQWRTACRGSQQRRATQESEALTGR